MAFAEEFDPLLTRSAVKLVEEGNHKDLVASNWHVSSVFMRMMCDGYILNSTSQGAPGIDFMEWQKTVFAGDRLSGRSTVLERRPLRSRPGIGIVRLRHEVRNQHGDLVCLGENAVMFATRHQPETSA